LQHARNVECELHFKALATVRAGKGGTAVAIAGKAEWVPPWCLIALPPSDERPMSCADGRTSYQLIP
jgi:hypothetical protein